MLKPKFKIIGLGLLLLSVMAFFILRPKKASVTYETAAVTKGSLITFISGTGTITSVNSTNISSKVSGIVSAVYVNNGDTVSKDQKIAIVELDEYARERQTTAWKNYLDAQETVKTMEKNKSTADIDMWQAQQSILDAEDDIEYKNNNSINPDTHEEYTQAQKTIIDKNLTKSRLTFTEAETKYKNADSEISAARAQVTAAWRDYQRNSATIVAPESGIVSNLNLAPGMVISSTSSSNNNASENSISAVSAQTFGKISYPKGSILATISLSEIDVTKVKANQKATLVFDAYEDLSFTGKVLAVDTSGSSNSGVTSYSVTLVLDPVDVDIYPNMSVSADIITDIQNDVLTVPTTVIQTQNNQSVVQVRKNGVISNVVVELGSANDLSTIIKSGLSEGDEVITSTLTNSSTTKSTSTTSPFSGVGSGSRSGGGMSGPPF